MQVLKVQRLRGGARTRVVATGRSTPIRWYSRKTINDIWCKVKKPRKKLRKKQMSIAEIDAALSLPFDDSDDDTFLADDEEEDDDDVKGIIGVGEDDEE